MACCCSTRDSALACKLLRFTWLAWLAAPATCTCGGILQHAYSRFTHLLSLILFDSAKDAGLREASRTQYEHCNLSSPLSAAVCTLATPLRRGRTRTGCSMSTMRPRRCRRPTARWRSGGLRAASVAASCGIGAPCAGIKHPNTLRCLPRPHTAASCQDTLHLAHAGACWRSRWGSTLFVNATQMRSRPGDDWCTKSACRDLAAAQRIGQWQDVWRMAEGRTVGATSASVEQFGSLVGRATRLGSTLRCAVRFQCSCNTA